MKKILKTIWGNKLALFVLVTGFLNLFCNNIVVGGTLIGCSIPMFIENYDEIKK